MLIWIAFLTMTIVDGDEPAPTRSVVLQKATGEAIVGTDWSVDSSHHVTLRTNEGEVTLPMASVLHLEFAHAVGAVPPAIPPTGEPVEGADPTISLMPNVDPMNLVGEASAPRSPPLVVLAGGQFVAGEILDSKDEALRVSNNSLGKLEIPISAVEGVLFSSRRTYRTQRRLIEQLRAACDRRDALLLTNEDILTGTIETWADDRWTIDVEGTEQAIESSMLRAAGFDRQLIEYERPESLYYVVTFQDGTTLHADRMEAVGGAKCRLHLVIGQEVETGRESIGKIGVRGGQAVYLSDLEADRTIVAPFLDDHRPPTRDEGFSGEPIALGSHQYDKGIVARGFTRLDFPAAGATHFLATLGIDASAGDRADFVCSILVDDKEAFRSGAMRSGSPPIEVNVPLRDATTLSLIVDFGNSGDVDDAAVWADARFLHP